MSLQLFVILAAGSAPDATAWNESLDLDGTSASFVEAVDLAQHSGYLPMTVGGHSGFEFRIEPYSELVGTYPSLAKAVVENPVIYSFDWGGDYYECAAVFFSASVLVSRFGGTAFDPQEDAFMSFRTESFARPARRSNEEAQITYDEIVDTGGNRAQIRFRHAKPAR